MSCNKLKIACFSAWYDFLDAIENRSTDSLKISFCKTAERKYNAMKNVMGGCEMTYREFKDYLSEFHAGNITKRDLLACIALWQLSGAPLY